MSDWNFIQLGIQIGIAIGQSAVFIFVVKAVLSKVDSLTEKHYQHTREVAEKYVKKEDLKDLLNELQNRLTFMHNDLARRLEKLEERNHEGK